MATTYRHRKAKDFDIHEDDPTTEDADADMRTEAEDDEAYAHEDHDDQPEEEQEEEQEEEHEQVEDDEAEAEADMSEEEELDDDMRKLQTAFNGFKHQYRLIKRIGEGMSTSRPGSDWLSHVLTSPRHILHRIQGPRPAV